jgi:Flp pilus assembly pilin Flp
MLIDYIKSLIASRFDERGQTMAEYAVVLAVITIAVVGTIGALSGAINDKLNFIIGQL